MKAQRSVLRILVSLTVALVLGCYFAGPSTLLAQDVEVASVDPNNASQGTTGLDVIITGKGFRADAIAKFVISGTDDGDGVTVNSTTYVNPTQLVANITVSSSASTTKFDTVVTLYSSGRTGKGIEKFSVVKKRSKSTCTLAPLPEAFTQVGVLNSGAYGGGFGSQVRAQRMTLGSVDVYVVAVGTNQNGTVEVFFLSTDGAILDGTSIGGNIQPHLTLPIPLAANGSTFGVREMQMGDVNADGVPDIVIGNKFHGKAYVYVSALQSGVVSYSTPFELLPPDNQSGFGADVAMGELDGNPDAIAGDEVVVGAVFFTTGDKTNGKVYVYKHGNSTFTLVDTLSSPVRSNRASDGFGRGVATGDVAGDMAPDLIVAATGVGKVFAFTGYIPSNGSESLSAAGSKVRAADVDGDTYSDVVTSVLSKSVEVFSGPVTTGQAPEFTLTPVAGLDYNFGQDLDTGDLNEDSFAEVISGAPNASNCPSVSNVGAAYIFVSAAAFPPQPPTPYLLQPPSLGGGTYGWSVGTAPGSRLFFVGETHRTINGVDAGQVYVYKVN